MVKNLRVNSDGFKKTKKYNISKLGLGILSVSLGVCTFLTSCVGTPKNNNDYYYVPSSSITSESGDFDILNDPMIKVDQNDYGDSVLNVSESAYTFFIQYINNFNTKYDYENYYNIDVALERYNQIKNQKVVQHSHSISEISVNELMKIVKENNQKYLEAEDKKYVSDFYEQFSDNELKKICNIIVSTINYYKEKNLIEDINELKCILGDLKILNKPTLTNAYVTDDNAIIISPLMIETLEIKNLDGEVDVYESTITHEIIHLLQKNCLDNNLYAYSIGNSYKFEDLSVNPLYYNWFYEGAAEKLATNKTKYKPIVYEFYINYINSLNLVSSLDKNNSPTAVEETALSNSLDGLYKTMGATTEEQQKEIIKLMFSLDIVETDTEDFIKAVNPQMSNDELVSIKRNLKGSICETLTKIFYKNLATLVKENKVPLQDVFYLITIFEADVDSHITYNDNAKYDACKEFFENYVCIQSEFFNFLASTKNYTQEEIERLFNEYGIVKSDGSGNFDLSYLPEVKKNFFHKMLNSVYDKSTEQIIDVYSRKTQKNIKN